MKKNRSDSEGLIIDVPEQLTAARRAAEAGLSTFAAVFWLLALRPLLLLGVWHLGGQVAYTHMVKLQGWNNPGYFTLLGAIFTGMAVLVVAWNRHNARRFRGRDRRLVQRAAGSAEVGAYFGMSAAALEQLRASPQLFVQRPERCEVVFMLADGARLEGRHDPVGPPPTAVPLHVPVAEVDSQVAVTGEWGV